MTHFSLSVEISDVGDDGCYASVQLGVQQCSSTVRWLSFSCQKPSLVDCEILREEGRSLIRSKLSQGPHLSNWLCFRRCHHSMHMHLIYLVTTEIKWRKGPYSKAWRHHSWHRLWLGGEPRAWWGGQEWGWPSLLLSFCLHCDFHSPSRQLQRAYVLEYQLKVVWRIETFPTKVNYWILIIQSDNKGNSGVYVSKLKRQECKVPLFSWLLLFGTQSSSEKPP